MDTFLGIRHLVGLLDPAGLSQSDRALYAEVYKAIRAKEAGIRNRQAWTSNVARCHPDDREAGYANFNKTKEYGRLTIKHASQAMDAMLESPAGGGADG
jgi:hypothetical protein